MALHNLFGKEGEAFALNYLHSQGYIVIDTNCRIGKFEIDLIARTANEVIFFEVKSRRKSDLSDPIDAVHAKKIRHIISAANGFLRREQLDLPARFDLLCLIHDGQSFSIEHIEDAFYPPLTLRR